MAIDLRSGVVATGLDEVLDLGAVGIAPDPVLSEVLAGAGQGGTAGAAGGDIDGTGEGGSVLDRLVMEGDGVDFITLEDGGAAGAVDFNADGKSGVGGSGGEECADGSGFKLQAGGKVVLNLEALVGGGAGEGPSTSDGAGEPKHEVEGVDALVHEGPAAVEGAGAAPAARVIIFLGAEPGDAGLHTEDPAKGALFDEAVHAQAGGVETVLGDDADLAAAGLLRGEDAVAGGGSGVHGFFDKHMLAGVEGVHGTLGVQAAGRAKDDRVDGGVGEQLRPRANGGASLGGQGAGAFGIDVGAGGQFRVGGERGNGFGVGGGDGAAAEEGKAERGGHSRGNHGHAGGGGQAAAGCHGNVVELPLRSWKLQSMSRSMAVLDPAALGLFASTLAALPQDEVRKAKLLYLRNAMADHQMALRTMRGYLIALGVMSLVPVFLLVFVPAWWSYRAMRDTGRQKILNALEVWREDLGAEGEALRRELDG